MPKSIASPKPRSQDNLAPDAPIAARTQKLKLPGNAKFPIVGIGASAGGLQALTTFFDHAPADSGMAFVVVQHLDPSHTGMMPELLQRHTAMPVAEARNRMKVKPDHVYVIPRNKDMSILHGALFLLEPVERRGLRLPIDFFFRSLAAECRERSAGVILSGMGSDGTLGLRAIKEYAGVTLVQEPESAAFSSMPKSAIDAGLADIIGTPEDLPTRIGAYFKGVLLVAPRDAEQPIKPPTQSSLEKIVILLREHTGNDFSQYKKSTLYRRVERRMALHQIDAIASYTHYLRENPEELELLFGELLIGVTSFFRDPAAWDSLIEKALPTLLATQPAGSSLRAWVPACSTGEEAYSLAIAFREALARNTSSGDHTLQIFATDLDAAAIEQARAGFYPANIAADVSPERLASYFIDQDKGYRVKKEIRDSIIFACQNVTEDPPFTHIDILSCRNLLIYLEPKTQQKLLRLFHYALNYHGVLMLGSAESIGDATYLFSPIDPQTRMYRRIECPLSQVGLEFPLRHIASAEPPQSQVSPPSRADIEQIVAQQLQAHHSPAAVLIDAAGDILHVSGHIERYLAIPAGSVNWNIFSMTHEDLRDGLAGALSTAQRKQAVVELKSMDVGSNGATHIVDVTVRPIEQSAAQQGNLLIVFSDITGPTPVRAATTQPPTPEARAATSKRRKTAASTSNSQLTGELLQSRYDMQKLREDTKSSQVKLRSSNEELQSANEELWSANEELQSMNEELTTSKEEMQSLNEELQTVNAELQAKALEMSCVTSDMENLLNSTEASTVFLDPELNIRRFTPHAKGLFKLLPVDIGRPLSHIVSDLEYSDLLADASEVLRTLIPSEKTVRTHDGRHFEVRITPYRNVANVIDGVVMSFTDISDAHATKAALEQSLKIVHEGLQARGERAEPAAQAEGVLRELQQLLQAQLTSPAPPPAKRAPDLLAPP